MFRNYIKTSLRSLWKSKSYSVINIAGLATGLATCLLIILYVLDELSYDQYNDKVSRIYRVNNEVKFGDSHFDLCQAPPLMGPQMASEFPQVEQYMRFMYHNSLLVKKGTENLRETSVILADSTLFDVFTLPMIAGNPATALKEPRSMVITERIAKKYFNRTDVVGQSLLINNTDNYKITGVIKNIPARSHFNFDFFIPMSEEEESRAIDSWASENFNTYVVLKKGTDPNKIVQQMDQMLDRELGPMLQSMLHTTLADFKKEGSYIRSSLTPLADIHLRSDKMGELSANGSITYVYVFTIIAAFILLIACVNFMNLSTARSANRAKEVGVRKVLGSLRKNLVAQFLTESMLISLLSSILAFMAAWALLPWFNTLAGKNISAALLLQPSMLATLLALMLLAGLLAGSYPAFFLSAFQPVKVLKGSLARGFKGSWLRNGLVVFQFFVSIVLIAGTLIIYKQLMYLRNKDIGFNREQVLIIQNTNVLGNNLQAFKNALLSTSGVQKATLSGYLPLANSDRSSDGFFTTPTLDQKTSVIMQRWTVDENYIPTLGINVIEGRNFSPDFPTDSSALIINEAAARFLGGRGLINKNLYRIVDNTSKRVIQYHIIGVVKNFNFNSMRELITPLAFRIGKQTGIITARLKTTDIAGLLSQLKTTWKSMAPGEPFTYSFMDEEFGNQFKAEQQTGKAFITFATLAIVIACLGLFGLATYAANQRSKEIGIRKVLGASAGIITGMLSKDFLKLVVIAALFAIPVAWWAMHQWLQDFAYRVQIGWWVFAIAGIAAAVIALLTVIFQALKAALANPVKALRSE